MQVIELKSRDIRAAISLILGIALSALYLTASLIFCMLYREPWYLAIALYQLALLVSRYYALFLSENASLKGKIDRLMTAASVILSLSLFYSAFFPPPQTKTATAVLVTLVYFLFLLLRFLLSLKNRVGDNVSFAVVLKLRTLSLLSALYALLLEFILYLSLSPKTEQLFSFILAFLSSYLTVTAVAGGKDGRKKEKF